MKKLVLSTLVAVSAGGLVYAQAKGAMKEAVDAGIARVAENGLDIAYDRATLEANGTITLNNVTMTSENGDSVLTAEYVTSTPTDTDGEVVLTFSPTMTLIVTPQGDEEQAYTAEILSDDLAITSNFVTQETTAPIGTITASSLQVRGLTEDHPVMKDLDITQTDIEMSFRGDEDAGTFSGTGDIGTLAGAYAFDMGAGTGVNAADFEVDGFEVAFNGVGFDDIDDKEFADFIENNGSFSVSMKTGNSTGSSTSEDPNFPIKMEGTSGPSTLDFSMGQEGMVYTVAFEGVDYDVTPTGDSMPIPPFTVSMGAGVMDFAVPMTAADAPEEARMKFELTELEVGEGLWNMVDPDATIPRDPANLDIDLTANVKLNTSLPEAAEYGGNPFDAADVENVTVKNISLNAAGVNLDANGLVTFDNSGPIPMPNGEIDVTLIGAQTLTNKLVELGLIDPMMSGMAMGMVMAFAKPGEGEDTFVSKVEFKDGGIFANGQPIQ